jgi:hypothetical protein
MLSPVATWRFRRRSEVANDKGSPHRLAQFWRNSAFARPATAGGWFTTSLEDLVSEARVEAALGVSRTGS